MNITKIIGTSMIALLVVALSVSMAVAIGFTINPDPINLPNEGTSPFTVYWDGNDAVTAHWKVLDANYVATTELQIQTGGAPYASSGTQVFAGGETLTYTVKDNGGVATADGDLYRIRFMDAQNELISDQIVTVKVNIVPEFATLAIPVVALLGLVLFMRRKKG